MRKFSLLAAGAVGFVLGSRSGRKPYEMLETKACGLARKPKVQSAWSTAEQRVDVTADRVQDKIDDARSAAEQRVDETADRVQHKVDDARKAAEEGIDTAADRVGDKVGDARNTAEEKLGSTPRGGKA